MQTTDWAEDAHTFYLQYHRNILKSEKAPSFFTDEKTAVSLLDSSPLLSQLDLTNLQDSPFAKLEEVRGWDVILRRLTSDPIYSDGIFDSGDGRMLTLLRRNIYGNLFPQDQSDDEGLGNILVVSRKKWALIECARWANGYYSSKEVRDVIKDHLKAYYVKAGLDSSNFVDDFSVDDTSEEIMRVTVVGSLAPDGNTPGRYVTLSSNTKPAKPGDIIYSTVPYCSAPMNIGATSSQAGFIATTKCCFHCCRDLSNKVSTSSSTVRDLSLLCELCNVSSIGYCSVQCRTMNREQHGRECGLLQKLFILVQTIEAENNKKENETVEEGGMAAFKALLVLRMALRAKTQPDSFAQLLEFEYHRERHLLEKPRFSADAERVATWIAENLTQSEIEAITSKLRVSSPSKKDLVTTLQNLFFAINVNAIGIGSEGVGIFPGIASMFNHSCNENITHSWDDNIVNKGSSSNNGVPSLCFRAVDDITPGDECTIGYIGTLNLPRKERVMPLIQHKFFDCQCSRCKQEIAEINDGIAGEHKEGITQLAEQWQQCMINLERLKEDLQHNKETEIETRRELCRIAESLFPRYFVTKGLCLEELAIAISESLNNYKKNVLSSIDDEHEIFALLKKAREQYKICRGENCFFVKRVDDFFHSLNTRTKDETSNNTSLCQSLPHVQSDADDDTDMDIIELTGWCETLFEIKTYEPMSVEELKELTDKIRCIDLEVDNCIKWAEGFRVYEVGYGILTVIMCGVVHEAVISKYDVSEIIQDRLDDIVQNVDII